MRKWFSPISWFASFAAIAAQLWFIWTVRFFPALDYPAWLYQGYVFAAWMQGRIPPGYTIRPYPVPNSTGVVVLGLLNLAFRPDVSGKILLTICAGLFVASSLYLFLSKAPTSSRRLLTCVSVFFAFNSFLYQGTVNYFIGLGLFFLYVGYALRHWERWPSRKVIGPSAFLCLLFMTHLMPYLMALLFSAIYFLLNDKWRTATRRISAVCAPSLILLTWYTLARLKAGDTTVATSLWQAWTLKSLESNFVRTFSGFFAFPPWDRPGLLATIATLADMLTSVAMAALLTAAAVLLARKRTSLDRAELTLLSASMLFVILFAILPQQFGDLTSPGERFLMPAAWLALAAIASRIDRGDPMYLRISRLRSVAELVMPVLIFVQIVYLVVVVRAASLGLEREYNRLAKSPPAEACSAYHQLIDASTPKNQRPLLSRVPYMMIVASELPYYLYLNDSKAVAPGYSTGPLKYGAGASYLVSYQIFCVDGKYPAVP